MQGSYCTSFWKRLGAFTIDFIILYTLVSLCIALFCILIKITPPTPSITSGIIVLATFLVISWLYFAITESSRKQASLGKRIFRIMVTDFRGDRITFNKATIRFWGKFVMPPFYSLIILIFKKKATHDVIAKTLVINKYIA